MNSLAPLYASEPIIIALNVAISGLEAEGDQGLIAGARLAVRKINEKGGVLNRSLQLTLHDNHSTDIGARNAALDIVKSQAIAMIGAGRSSRSLVAAEVLQKAKVPMVMPFSTHPAITKIGNYIFRVGFTDEFQGQTLGDYAYRSLRAKKIIILENVSEEYSSILANHFTESFEEHGGKITWRGHYRGKTMDFASLLNEVKTKDYDLIFLPGYSKRSAWLIKQARHMGITARFLGGDGWGTAMYKYGGKNIDGHLSADHWHQDIDTKENQNFLAVFKEAYGNDRILSTGTPLAFDAVNLIVESLKKVGRSERQALKNGLQNLKNFQGVTGAITFNVFGDPKNKNIVITKFKNQEKELMSVVQGSPSHVHDD